ncbi:epoxide hydrolase family protein [Leifsonia shinshuensis]|uniref:Epoxide hydrolase 1 n=1 Tax=Leifsonia shinshuensis TaxID=150026 RepID=A0A7G6Y973_9MICO|nr:epoxide hydrolase [Leifsonia shinshuensis]QNE35038.1 epoxide hydrolase 1 [Leifsonia shinshuensis]
MAIDDFRLHVPDDVLADLRDRLARTRYLRSPRPGWEGGPGDTELRALVDGWLAFDWRAEEERLNAVEQHVAEVAGHRIHFARVRGAGDGPHTPLLLLHGWPSAFVEYLPLARLLSDSFDVVIPSLPGFVFSEPLEPPLTRRAIADALHGLMTEALGFDRYATFGGDIGGGASTWLGVDHPDSVVGIQLLSGPFPEGDPVGEEEARYLVALDEYDRLDGGYSEIMLTRPDTIAAALNDSPAGLLAWIADKWHDWIDTDSDGTWQRVVDSGILYTIATLYWTTESIGTSFQQYYDYDRNPPRPPLASPVGVYLAREPAMAGFPRSLAERAAPRLEEFAQAPAGGHFAGFEHPEAAAEAIRGFHARLRDEG